MRTNFTPQSFTSVIRINFPTVKEALKFNNSYQSSGNVKYLASFNEPYVVALTDRDKKAYESLIQAAHTSYSTPGKTPSKDESKKIAILISAINQTYMNLAGSKITPEKFFAGRRLLTDI